MAQRLDRGWFQKDAFDHFRDRFNWAEDSRASYGNWERGQAEPSGEVARAILEEYGFDELPPEEEPVQAVSQSDALVSALARQSEAIEALVREMQWARAAQIESAEVTLRALGSLGARLDPPGTPVGSEPDTRVGTPR